MIKQLIILSTFAMMLLQCINNEENNPEIKPTTSIIGKWTQMSEDETNIGTIEFNFVDSSLLINTMENKIKATDSIIYFKSDTIAIQFLDSISAYKFTDSSDEFFGFFQIIDDTLLIFPTDNVTSIKYTYVGDAHNNQIIGQWKSDTICGSHYCDFVYNNYSTDSLIISTTKSRDGFQILYRWNFYYELIDENQDTIPYCYYINGDNLNYFITKSFTRGSYQLIKK